MPASAVSAVSTASPVHVRQLDENTANRIAAGEVVERPSSVVKELVENAIDAGATRIEIELSEGGKHKIIVRDNGCGMGEGDAALSLQRHATSKIRSADDLFAIGTLGFRGEALPSIASVSDFSLLTKRPEDDAATKITVRGGDVVSVEPAGAPDGTTITVENLFFNVPARLKFLKTTSTELNHATEIVQRMMLVYPRLAFRLTHDDYEMIAYPGANDPLHAIAAVWGRDVARAMVPIRYESPAIAVRGFVSDPSVSKATRSAQAFFVNGRFVRSRIVQHAFDTAFKSFVDTHRYPVVALFVEIAPELVDVNVHPTKIEVRFTKDGDVYGAVHHAVKNALLGGGLIPQASVSAASSSALPTATTEPVSARPPRAALSSWARGEIVLVPGEGEIRGPSPPAAEGGCPPPPITRQSGYPGCRGEEGENGAESSPRTPSLGAGVARSDGGEGPPNPSPDLPSPSSSPGLIGFDNLQIGRLRVIGQARNRYIVAETEDAVLLIDQHVAHERVLYEQMMNQAQGETDGSGRWGTALQHLALPQTLELAPREGRVVGERIAALTQAGFLLEPFGGSTFVLRAVPARVAQKDYLGTLRQIIEELTETSSVRRLLVPHESAVIMASCKMAVKAGDPLTLDEMTRLLTDLAQMKNPFTCPHGRPILLAVPHHEMDRKFHRIGPH